MANQPKKISEITLDVYAKRIGLLRKFYIQDLEIADQLNVKFSLGNTKTGTLVPSVSLMPVLNCGNCEICKGLCYALRNVVRYAVVMKSYANNAAIFKKDPKRYFDEISEFCKMQIAFRWHVSGDIINMEYFEGMVRVAKERPNTHFLCFTKMFKIVNEYMKKHKLPKNLQIVFSGWVGLKMDNPYNLPTSHPKFIDGTTSSVTPAPYLCGGNCTKCLIEKQGCWNLKKGEEVIFPAH